MIPILKQGTRILRPSECKKILDQIPKLEHETQFKMLLYSGMRYIEAKRLYDHEKKCPKNERWFDRESGFIKLGKMAVKKEKVVQKERWVRLNMAGKTVVPYFLNLPKNLPSNVTWRENLRRWARQVGLDPIGLCPKTTRKTWESWLIYHYMSSSDNPITVMVAQSQGHTKLVQLEHYLNMPFTQDDKAGMKEFCEGWV